MKRALTLFCCLASMQVSAACERSYEVSDALLSDFVVFSYRDIANDLISGSGPYLEVLETTLAPACTPTSELLHELRQALMASDSAPDFARRVTALKSPHKR